jgi:hypothetical protein
MTVEQTAAECLAASAGPAGWDGLLELAGILDCELRDVAERHDAYIGQALRRRWRAVAAREIFADTAGWRAA